MQSQTVKAMELSFREHGKAETYLRDGRSFAEENFRWSIGGHSGMNLPIEASASAFELELDVMPHVNLPRLPHQQLTIMVNGQQVLTSVLTGSRQMVLALVPAGAMLGPSSQSIAFVHPLGIAPCDLGSAEDARPIAIAFFSLKILRVADPSTNEAEEDLVPPASMLFHGAISASWFRQLGEGFTRGYLIERSRLLPHERVLDIGSGNGQKAGALARYLIPKGSYEGIDVVADGVAWCQRAYRRFPNFRFQQAEIYSSHYNQAATGNAANYRLPYADAEFDLVFLCSVFTHMPAAEVANYISEISRVLKPGGRCVMTFFLLNPDTQLCWEQGKSQLDFRYATANGRLLDVENPSKAIALDEASVRAQFRRTNLAVCETTYGTWSGSPDLIGGLQDCLIAVRT
jgi:SAM-dependent methyltransferase